MGHVASHEALSCLSPFSHIPLNYLGRLPPCSPSPRPLLLPPPSSSVMESIRELEIEVAATLLVLQKLVAKRCDHSHFPKVSPEPGNEQRDHLQLPQWSVRRKRWSGPRDDLLHMAKDPPSPRQLGTRDDLLHMAKDPPSLLHMAKDPPSLLQSGPRDDLLCMAKDPPLQSGPRNDLLLQPPPPKSLAIIKENKEKEKPNTPPVFHSGNKEANHSRGGNGNSGDDEANQSRGGNGNEEASHSRGGNGNGNEEANHFRGGNEEAKANFRAAQPAAVKFSFRNKIARISAENDHLRHLTATARSRFQQLKTTNSLLRRRKTEASEAMDVDHQWPQFRAPLDLHHQQPRKPMAARTETAGIGNGGGNSSAEAAEARKRRVEIQRRKKSLGGGGHGMNSNLTRMRR